ncbi:MAG: HAD-IIIA family hydrolase [Bacteriovoracaceae bacterium]|jgi:D-glycero-D-manno-heptose 1,7-bisphosphate phosphatase|nr:HAD-IIIA family hydrolase [Bacteriovoracaceae bacterium]
MKEIKLSTGSWIVYSKNAEEYFLGEPQNTITGPSLAVTSLGASSGIVMDKGYNKVQEKNKIEESIDYFSEIEAVYFPDGMTHISRYEEAKEIASHIYPTFKAPSDKARGCLLLDRDGIIITDKGYINNPDDCDLMPGVIDLIRWARNKNWKVICLTNQAGIAKDKILPLQLEEVTARVDELLAKYDCAIDKWYFCPYHIEGSVSVYVKQSMSRKPFPGMLLNALNDFNVDMRQMVFVGDKESDLLLAPYLECFLLKGRYPIDEQKYADICYKDYESLNRAINSRFI